MATNRIPMGAPQGISTESQSAQVSPQAPYQPGASSQQSADFGGSISTSPPHAADQSNPPPSHPDFQRPPVDAASAVIPKSELEALRAAQQQLAEIRSAQLAAQELEQQKQWRAQAKDDPQGALDRTTDWWKAREKEMQAKFDALEQERLSERLEASLVSSVTGYRLVGDTEDERMETARMLMNDLRPRLEAIRTADGRIEVREKVSGRPAADMIRELLTSKRYALFFAPTSRGGSGTDGTRTPANPQYPPEQLNDFQRQQIDFIKARMNPQAPFGLRGVYPSSAG